MAKIRGAGMRDPTPTLVSCHLLGEMWQNRSPQSSMRVLDVGSAAASTVNFFNRHFSRQKCYLAFPDLYAESFVSGTQPDIVNSDLVALFKAALNIKPGVSLDICLFWDFFSYLRRPYIAAMLEALGPHLSATTRGYCLGSMHAAQMPHYHYGLADANNMTQVRRLESVMPLHGHTQSELGGLLKPFVITKSRLMDEGRLECLLFYKSAAGVASSGSVPQF
ncbi:MAG: hypothetical protein OSA42_01000 [Porticoccaceae bacterium]|nr:hypothetical protein [Porticoccaceae bacterium]